MATHSNTLAWNIPWTVEPGRLQSMGSQKVRHGFTFFLFFSVYCTKWHGRREVYFLFPPLLWGILLLSSLKSLSYICSVLLSEIDFKLR